MGSQRFLRVLTFCMLVVWTCSLAACAPAPEAASPLNAAAKTVTVTIAQEPDVLNTLYSSSWTSSMLAGLWLRSLWSYDPNNVPVLEVAAELPTVANGGLAADGKSLTIKLRPDAVWSDGIPVTADDYVFTYDMIMADGNKPESRYPYDEYVEQVQAVDDHTLQIKLTEPLASWQSSLFAYVLPKHVLEPVFSQEGTLDNAEWNRKPAVGIGPYVLSEWESGSHLVFQRSEHWFGEQPAIDRIFVRIVPDDAAQVAAIKAGDSDIGSLLSFTDLDDIEANGQATTQSALSGYVEGMYLNFDAKTGHAALQDRRVRQALVFATDRAAIIRDLLKGRTSAPETFWDATPPYGDHAVKPYQFDPEKARSLLEEAGWVDSNGNGTRDKDGVELVLRYVTDDRQMRQDVQAVVQQMWAAVGIGSELQAIPSDILFGSYQDGGPLATGAYDVAEFSNSTAFPDPDASEYWLCSEIPSPDYPLGSNWQSYCNEQLDALLEQQATTSDPEERPALYQEIEQIMHDDVVWVGLWLDPDLWSVSKRLSNVKFSGATPFWNVTEWDVTP